MGQAIPVREGDVATITIHTGKDQHACGQPIPPFCWSLIRGGAMRPSGIYTAGLGVADLHLDELGLVSSRPHPGEGRIRGCDRQGSACGLAASEPARHGPEGWRLEGIEAIVEPVVHSQELGNTVLEAASVATIASSCTTSTRPCAGAMEPWRGGHDASDVRLAVQALGNGRRSALPHG
jgi:hypothetical protein